MNQYKFTKLDREAIMRLLETQPDYVMESIYELLALFKNKL